MQALIHVIPTLSSGGAEKVCMRLHQTALEQGYSSHLIVLSEICTYDIKDIPNIYRLPLNNAKNLDVIWKQKKALQLLSSCIQCIEQKETVLAVFGHLDEASMLLQKLAIDAPVLHIIHTSIAKELASYRRMSWLKFIRLKRKKKALVGQHLITVSPSLKAETEQESWLKPLSIKAIFNPFDIQEIRSLAKVDKKPPVAEPYIIHAGRYAKAKRHDILFDAFQLILRKTPSLKLVLLCRVSKKLKKELARRDLTDNVILPGQVDNPYYWMKHAKLLLLSSDYEGLSNVLVEALACETPVVSTDCPSGPSDVLQGFHEDWLVPCRDANALAERANELIETAPEVDLNAWPLRKEVEPTRVLEHYIAAAKAAGTGV
jgi:glycosyltransferase involved in cell wall biosynthesis